MKIQDPTDEDRAKMAVLYAKTLSEQAEVLCKAFRGVGIAFKASWRSDRKRIAEIAKGILKRMGIK